MIANPQKLAQEVQLRRDGYLPAPDSDLTPEERHRHLLQVTLPRARPDAVVSHASAGLLWGLPVPRRLLARVHLTANQPSGAYRGNQLHVHVATSSDNDSCELDGYATTGLARTAVDLSRLCSPREALAVMDAAVAKAGKQALVHETKASAGRHGISAARWALEHADPLAESPGESLCRYWMIVGNVLPPVLQFEIRDDSGALLGRADFGWPEHGVLGEFDGRIKYGSLVPVGETAADVIMREKERENRLRRAGWWVMRWTWDDLRDGQVFARQLNDFLSGKPIR